MTNDDLAAKLKAYEDAHPEDMSDEWKCVLCDWEIKLKEPHIIGMVCCGGCGMTTLRPKREVLGRIARHEMSEEDYLGDEE